MNRRATIGNVAAPQLSVNGSVARGRICVVHAAEVAGIVTPIVADLRAERYDVVSVGSDAANVAWITAADPDLVIVLASETFDMRRMCESLRETIDCRILVLGDVDRGTDEQTIIEALDAGADDFIHAAVGTPVLLARIRVALRAAPLRDRAPKRIVLGDVLIDRDAHAVLVDGAPVNCPPLQFGILLMLASSPGSMVLRDSLISEVWGIPPATVDPRRVRIAISVLRRVIGSGPRRPTIESVSRIGYRLVPPIETGLNPVE